MTFNDEWLAADREHEQKMAHTSRLAAEDARRHRREVMEEWTRRVGIVVAGLCVVAIILGITYAVWDSDNKEREANERLVAECIESGGTWTYLGTTAGKTCVFLKDGGQ